MDEQEEKAKAWVGDAVLALFAREWILQQKDIELGERAAVFTGMTSNQFLSAFGRPTQVEASIGIIYERDGLPAAFAHIEQVLLPVFKKQRLRPRRPGSWRDRLK